MARVSDEDLELQIYQDRRGAAGGFDQCHMRAKLAADLADSRAEVARLKAQHKARAKGYYEACREAVALRADSALLDFADTLDVHVRNDDQGIWSWLGNTGYTLREALVNLRPVASPEEEETP